MITKLPTCLLPPGEIAAIFEALDVLRKIDSGRLRTLAPRVSPAKQFPRGQSLIYLHVRRSDGMHVATTHVLTDAERRVRHRHGKDIVLGSIKFTQADEPRGA